MNKDIESTTKETVLLKLSKSEIRVLAITLYNEYELRSGVRWTVNGVDIQELEKKLRSAERGE